MVTDGISSIAATDGLVGPRFALAMVAVVGLVGLIVLLCTETTGKGPACPGFECCQDKGEGEARERKYCYDKEQTLSYVKLEIFKACCFPAILSMSFPLLIILLNLLKHFAFYSLFYRSEGSIEILSINFFSSF